MTIVMAIKEVTEHRIPSEEALGARILVKE
jgi:hypothetical protein